MINLSEMVKNGMHLFLERERM